jgi:pimeloyl-ACP methyl ester carboxylesterase
VVGEIDWSRYDLPVADRPVLVLRGGRDVAPVYPRPEDLLRSVTDPDIVTIPGQGHLAVNLAPFDLEEYVHDFIDRH